MGLDQIKVLEHITDQEMEVTGQDIDEAFENAGLALEETMVNTSKVEEKVNVNIDLFEHDDEALLYAFLDRLIYLQDAEGLVFHSFCATEDGGWSWDEENKNIILGRRLWVSCRGEPFDPEKHEFRTAIKAATYHTMKIDKDEMTGKNVKMHFLLDL